MVSLLATQENSFDAKLQYLLSHGQTLTRPVFAARLTQLSDQLSGWSSMAQLLRRPVLAHHVNDVVGTLTEQRVDDYATLLSDLAHQLQIPWVTPVVSQVVTNPAASLVATVQQWDVARWSLTREPGRVTLPELSMGAAKYYVVRGIGSLTSSPSLAVVRGIGIVAVEVTPSPLPAPTGVLVLPPVNSVQLGISVQNSGFVDQPVTLTVTLVPRSGPTQRQVDRVVIGPLDSYAFVPASLSTAPSERATLTISVSGAPAGPLLSTSRTYTLQMSPSGNG